MGRPVKRLGNVLATESLAALPGDSAKKRPAGFVQVRPLKIKRIKPNGPACD